jgi:hypothetical protein
LEDDQAVVRVEAIDPASPGVDGASQTGRPRNFLDVTATLIGPELKTTELSLAQVGAGRYEAGVEVWKPGTYLVRLGISQGGRALGQQTLGLVVPYSPEYKAGGTDRAFLNELAHLTGGGELSKPGAVFLHNLPVAERAREIWWSLLLLVTLLFPLDVALRRVMLGPSDLDQGFAWLRKRIPARREAHVARERVLGRLFEARDRIRGRRFSAEKGLPASVEPPDELTSSPPMKQDVEPAPATEDALVRLRQAKKRARRDRRGRE